MKMDTEEIEKLLTQVMVGGNMSSLRVSGEWVSLYFSACNVKDVTQVSIDTNSWVFVEDGNKRTDCENIDETDFFKTRRDILPELYDLTGYDIESVSLVQEKSLRILINGHVVMVCPKLIKATNIVYYESWRIITSDENGDQWLVQLEAENLLTNNKHPLLSGVPSNPRIV